MVVSNSNYIYIYIYIYKYRAYLFFIDYLIHAILDLLLYINIHDISHGLFNFHGCEAICKTHQLDPMLSVSTLFAMRVNPHPRQQHSGSIYFALGLILDQSRVPQDKWLMVQLISTSTWDDSGEMDGMDGKIGFVDKVLHMKPGVIEGIWIMYM